MTGPQHYTEAQRLLAIVKRGAYTGDDTASLIAAAQVHATLAQAAATIDATRMNPEGWLNVLDTTNP